MHPAIRIINFLILLGVLAHARLEISLSVFLLSLVFFISDTKTALNKAAQFYWRLRWILLSISILYLLVIPGTPLLPDLRIWQPSREGVSQVAQRLMAWWTIVFLFALFSQRTTASQWQSGLYVLLKPFAVLGLPVEQLLLRMALTLQAVNALQQHLLATTPKPVRLTWSGLIDRLQALLKFTSDQAEQAPLHVVEVNVLPAPLWYHWAVPVFLLATLLGLERVRQLFMAV